MDLKVLVAHDGELLQILRLGIDVGTHIDEDGGGALGGGKNGSQRRTIDAGNRAQDHLGGGHGRSGIAGSDEAFGFAVAHQAKADAHGRIALAAHRLRGLFLHADDLRGIDNADGKPAPEAVQVEFGANHILFAHQHDFHVIVAGGENSAFDFGFGRAVGAHGVNER